MSVGIKTLIDIVKISHKIVQYFIQNGYVNKNKSYNNVSFIFSKDDTLKFRLMFKDFTPEAINNLKYLTKEFENKELFEELFNNLISLRDYNINLCNDGVNLYFFFGLMGVFFEINFKKCEFHKCNHIQDKLVKLWNDIEDYIPIDVVKIISSFADCKTKNVGTIHLKIQ